nr:hypothetical protein CFP56_46597 [Quercus suber]
MAFSTRRGGGRWAQSLLPFSSNNPKSKLTRKSRRQFSLKDFIFANFFTIGLIFFLLVILQYSVPKPISSHFNKSTAANLRRAKPPISNHYRLDPSSPPPTCSSQT